MSQDGIKLLDLNGELRAQLKLIDCCPSSMKAEFYRRFTAIADVAEFNVCNQFLQGSSSDPVAPEGLQDLMKTLIRIHAMKAERYVSLTLGRKFGRYWASQATESEIDRLFEANADCEGDWPGEDFVPCDEPTLPSLFYSVVCPTSTPQSADGWWKNIVGDVLVKSGITVNDLFVTAFARGAIAYYTPKKRYRRMSEFEAALCMIAGPAPRVRIK